jgi:hypothetical protein
VLSSDQQQALDKLMCRLVSLAGLAKIPGKS